MHVPITYMLAAIRLGSILHRRGSDRMCEGGIRTFATDASPEEMLALDSSSMTGMA